MNLGHYSNQLLEYEPNFKERIKKTNKNLKILRIICQKPFFTGSGINFINLIKKSKKYGIEQAVVFGLSAVDENPLNELISRENTYAVRFKDDDEDINYDVPFPIAGMSDRMPYKSTRFSSFTLDMLENYLKAFAININRAVEEFQPNIIHVHHLWLVSALTRVLQPKISIIATCHNTALRQLILAPHLKKFIVKPISDLDKIAVIGKEQEGRVIDLYDIENQKLNNKFLYIGQGINTDLFYPLENPPLTDSFSPKKLIYIGKLCFSKGVPQLLHAFEEIQKECSNELKLYIAGSGEGHECDEILIQAKNLNKSIKILGQLDQKKLAEFLQECDIFVLPSFYDGFPKVLLESLACGCKAVVTDLPGIREHLQETLGEIKSISFVPRPVMKSIDEPFQEALPEFITNLNKAIKYQLFSQITMIEKRKTLNQIQKHYGDDSLFHKYLTLYNQLVSSK